MLAQLLVLLLLLPRGRRSLLKLHVIFFFLFKISIVFANRYRWIRHIAFPDYSLWLLLRRRRHDLVTVRE